MTDPLARLDDEIVRCRACPRLVAWREEVARTKRASFRDDAYWGRPITGFGDPDPWLMIIGLAPAAHGANRTGRVFTGDRSADFLVAAMHRADLASQPTSERRDDGLVLRGCRMTAAVRCAPPANKPTPAEARACQDFLARELAICSGTQVLLALGAVAWQATLRVLAPPRPWPRFGHAATATLDRYVLLGSYHPSQQNTFTGRLTPAMMDEVFAQAHALAATRSTPGAPAERSTGSSAGSAASR